MGRRGVYTGGTRLVLGVDVCTALQQQSHHRCVSGCSSAVQRGALILLACTLQLSPRVEQGANGSSVAAGRRREQIRRHATREASPWLPPQRRAHQRRSADVA